MNLNFPKKPDLMVVSNENYKIWLEVTAPSLHALYCACWKAGLTVNGLKP